MKDVVGFSFSRATDEDGCVLQQIDTCRKRAAWLMWTILSVHTPVNRVGRFRHAFPVRCIHTGREATISGDYVQINDSIQGPVTISQHGCICDAPCYSIPFHSLILSLNDVSCYLQHSHCSSRTGPEFPRGSTDYSVALHRTFSKAAAGI